MSSGSGYLGLGSNLGDRLNYLRGAINQLERRGVKVVAQSSVYEAPPWGFASPNRFYNAVVEIRWDSTPEQLQAQIEEVERVFWRIKKKGPRLSDYQDRTIDIDILWLDGVELDLPHLKIPHPLAHKRAFVLVPWCELAPELVLREKSLAQWLNLLLAREVQEVKRVGEL